MAWTTSKSSAVAFVLGKAISALEEIRRQEIAGTESEGSLAKIICDATDLCRERIANFSSAEVKDRIMITVSNLLDMVVVLMRLIKQVDEKGLTVEIRSLMLKSGLVKEHELRCT